MGYYKREFEDFLQEDYEYIASREQFWLEYEQDMEYKKLQQEVFGKPVRKIRKQPKWVSKHKKMKSNFNKFVKK